MGAEEIEACFPQFFDGAGAFFDALLFDDEEGFRIVLVPQDQTRPRLLLTWPGFPNAFRSINESFRLALWQALPSGIPSNVCKVNNSRWLAEFHRDSFDAYVDRGITHYLVVTAEDVIDVLTSEPPVPAWLPQQPRSVD